MVLKQYLELVSVRDGVRIAVVFTVAALIGTLAFGELISWLIAYPVNWKQYVLRAVIPLFVAPAVVVPLIVMNLRLNRLRAEMDTLARTDPLTGLPNRRAFFMRAGEIFVRLQGQGPAAVLMIDIDRFKMINDAFGHDAGDAVLRTVAQTIAKVSAGQGAHRALAARIGGEEFAVVIDGIGLPEASALAAQICVNVHASTTAYGGASIRATVSVGVALRHDDEPIDVVLKAADTAVYEAKRAGRDRWCVATPAAVGSGQGASHDLRTRPYAA